MGGSTFISGEKERLMLKLITNNKILPLKTRSASACRLHSDSISESKRSLTTFRKVCVLTGRSVGVIKKEKVSRLKFKKLIESGLLCGVRKSS
jgi:ribosomal protein S14